MRGDCGCFQAFGIKGRLKGRSPDSFERRKIEKKVRISLNFKGELFITGVLHCSFDKKRVIKLR